MIIQPTRSLLNLNGNHDIYSADSLQAYETWLQFPGSMGNGPVQLTDDWVFIGEGGWYDYSFGMPEYSSEQFAIGTFNDFTWPNKQYANWQSTDGEVTNHSVEKLENWLQKYRGKKIIMVTHVVPFERYIQTKNNPAWDFFNAMMGGKRFGELAAYYWHGTSKKSILGIGVLSISNKNYWE